MQAALDGEHCLDGSSLDDWRRCARCVSSLSSVQLIYLKTTCTPAVGLATALEGVSCVLVPWIKAWMTV